MESEMSGHWVEVDAIRWLHVAAGEVSLRPPQLGASRVSLTPVSRWAP